MLQKAVAGCLLLLLLLLLRPLLTVDKRHATVSGKSVRRAAAEHAIRDLGVLRKVFLRGRRGLQVFAIGAEDGLRSSNTIAF
eukprot:gene18679-58736_t